MTTKLVRDRIPEIMRHEGKPFVGGRLNLTEPAEHAEYVRSLRRKLIEEAVEAFHSTTPDDLAEELADLLEVIDALIAVHPEMPVQQIKRHKLHERGGFKSGWIMRT